MRESEQRLGPFLGAEGRRAPRVCVPRSSPCGAALDPLVEANLGPAPAVAPHQDALARHRPVQRRGTVRKSHPRSTLCCGCGAACGWPISGSRRSPLLAIWAARRATAKSGRARSGRGSELPDGGVPTVPLAPAAETPLKLAGHFESADASPLPKLPLALRATQMVGPPAPLAPAPPDPPAPPARPAPPSLP